MAFPGLDPIEVPGQEYAWWRQIAQQTFAAVDQLAQFADFEAFFADLYTYFATAEPWVVYADTRSSLERWRSLGIELGVLSNFDSRLYGVLQALQLDAFFQSVTISTEVGAAKPSPAIFHAALRKHGYAAADAWHVGDSRREDVAGAKAVGLRGIWLMRSQPAAA
ncbi:Phosphoglycolate phosphatase [Halomicronema hongdechloris C2206]|uniref:Phosphoglycolate phosphatase n=1 Tax=Halomicronema hongdechloris C2206 TaxID=1641165 RepID=A0A1Z3HU32_9CYAN|nr:HAD-IA family hydrolase [Halomicronema hongdechloris]ASC73637.1 Phosphoglycolate phosphatase [Halomicronema hongdechloris C2206]